MHNRLITNLVNVGLLGMFFMPEMFLLGDIANKHVGTKQAFDRYLKHQTFGLTEFGSFNLESGMHPRGQAPRVLAAGINEGKKYALGKMQVR